MVKVRMEKNYKTKKTNIVAVIVTYNRLDTLKLCLSKIQSQSIKTDIMVYDNASSDGTYEWCKNLDSIFYIHSNVNDGSSGGFNKAIKAAVELDYEYLWIMDDDCLPKNDSLEQLINADKVLEGNYGWLSSKCLWIDGSICNMNIQRKNIYKKVNFTENNKLIDAQYATFVSLFIKKDIIKKYGLPIKDFYITGDDWEYTRRISKYENCYVVTDSEVIHAMKDNIDSDISLDNKSRLFRYFYSFRNEVYIFRREGYLGWAWLILKCVYNSLKCIYRFKFRRILIIWNGFFKGLFFHSTIEHLD